MKWLVVFVGFLLTSVAVSERASADLFRCRTADGKVVFTDREDACPGAEPHTINAEIQTYVPTPAAVAPQSPSAVSPQGAQGTDAMEGVWREKKVSTEKELEALEEKWDYLNQYITHCNRNRTILSEKASGLRYEVSCKTIRKEHAQVKARMNEARTYLNEGLAEACRRAGCLPGWIR